MTAWGTIDLAVEGMRRGAQDFIEKPWDNERLLTVLRTQVALGRALQRARTLEAENRQLKGGGDALIADSPAMQPVLETIERVAPTDANVLITGESGCGKGLVARLIHEGSPRRERSLVTVNIGSLAETVFESEMFGHVKGAFTDAKNDRVGRFELADGGTLFLDEIANIPVAQQGRLLRVLEDGQFERLGSSRTQQRRRARARGDERRHRRRDRGRAVPRRPAVPVEHDPHSFAAAARARRRHRAARAAVLEPARAASPPQRHGVQRAGAVGAAPLCAGPATCASSTTSSSAPCSWRAARRSSPRICA